MIEKRGNIYMCPKCGCTNKRCRTCHGKRISLEKIQSLSGKTRRIIYQREEDGITPLRGMDQLKRLDEKQFRGPRRNRRTRR